MTTSVKSEIAEIEERLRKDDLGPDPEFFKTYLEDQMVLMSDGETVSPKAHIVEMHQPGKGQKFDRIEMTDIKILEQGDTVTCAAHNEGPKDKFAMNFMRIWVRKPEGWKIVAGAAQLTQKP